MLIPSRFLIALVLLCSCSLSDSELIERVNNANRIEIVETYHGGIGGEGHNSYVLQRNEHFPKNEDWILIRDENTQFQTYVVLDSAQHANFLFFLQRALQTHDVTREYDNSCTTFGPNPNEYDIHVDLYSKHLQPDEKTDSLFSTLATAFCPIKHVYK
ncbi:hypothetical protein [Fulvivirga ligni]|uniref:hypothetical protein n=1 Tax=Fulvivirga ligni TaxID=2904246 RepID=UPI001F25BEAA|nr:hypothetical protein [Fulvivirga ligni]UII24290.1 hypothetical protein LVD16_13795 [Fulvivirga ligni]